jgi:hypothetical protein
MKGEKLPMTSKSMRSFAGGLMVAAGVCGAVYFLNPSEATSTQTVEKISVDEMKNELTSKGYVIHTDKEWQDQLATVKADAANVKKETKEKIIYRTILSVSSGMTSIDVGKALQRTKIIKNGLEFSKEVEKRGLENDLRPGTYKIESGMTMEEMISTIFK